MKATEYFEKYKEQMEGKTPEEQKDVAFEMYKEIRNEMFDVAKKRNIKFKQSLVDLIKETNEKWNKIAALFAINEICTILKIDGFYNSEICIFKETELKVLINKLINKL